MSAPAKIFKAIMRQRAAFLKGQGKCAVYEATFSTVLAYLALFEAVANCVAPMAHDAASVAVASNSQNYHAPAGV
jgi:hypothetical protein